MLESMFSLEAAKKMQAATEEMYSDTPVTGHSAENLLTAARAILLGKYPFYGRISWNMAFIPKPGHGTTSVDVKGRMYYDPRWVNGFDMNDAVFELAHETMHLVQRMWARAPDNCRADVWNLAADFMADTTLVDSGLTQSKISALNVTPQIQAKTRELGTVERVYMWLLKEMAKHSDCAACKEESQQVLSYSNAIDKDNSQENAKINQQNNTGIPSKNEEGNEDDDGEGGNGEQHNHSSGRTSSTGSGTPHTCMNVRQCCAGMSADFDKNKADPLNEQKWKEIAVAAADHARGRGNMPGPLGEVIDALTKSTVRWQDYLRHNAARVFGQRRYSFQKLPRRAAGMGKLSVRLPRSIPDGSTAIVAVDTSGSMSNDEVRQCLTESAEILKQTGADKIFVILHDTRVYYADFVGPNSFTKLKMSRGGTSHEEVFKLIEERTLTSYDGNEFTIPQDVEINFAVMFTDLGTFFPDCSPSYELIWGVPSDGCPGMDTKVPYGMKVEMDMKEMRT